MDSITLDKIPAYIETYLSIRDRVKQNDIERAKALKQLAAARKDAGFDTNTNIFLTASVEDLKALTADFSRHVVSETELSTVGAYNSTTGKWENPQINNSDISRVGVEAYNSNSKQWV